MQGKTGFGLCPRVCPPQRVCSTACQMSACIVHRITAECALLRQVEGGPDGDAAHFAFDFYAMHGRGGGGGNDMGEGPVVNSEDAEGESRRCGSQSFARSLVN